MLFSRPLESNDRVESQFCVLKIQCYLIDYEQHYTSINWCEPWKNNLPFYFKQHIASWSCRQLYIFRFALNWIKKCTKLREESGSSRHSTWLRRQNIDHKSWSGRWKHPRNILTRRRNLAKINNTFVCNLPKESNWLLVDGHRLIMHFTFYNTIGNSLGEDRSANWQKIVFFDWGGFLWPVKLIHYKFLTKREYGKMSIHSHQWHQMKQPT